MSKLSDPGHRQGHSIDDSDGKRSFDSRPKVGQSRPYKSGNAHGRHERATRGPDAGEQGVSRSDGPFKRSSGTKRDL
jgi:hypothetical protein